MATNAAAFRRRTSGSAGTLGGNFPGSPRMLPNWVSRQRVGPLGAFRVTQAHARLNNIRTDEKTKLVWRLCL